tara:strand:+ start:222 stop:536 length:315 start_codon:yes stop_codon:yes gene_type:complete
MRYRVAKLIDASLEPSAAGEALAAALLDTKIDWRNLELQLTGVPADTLIDAFWRSFFEAFQKTAPELFPDIAEAVWICDHEFQEDMIYQCLEETLAGPLLSIEG